MVGLGQVQKQIQIETGLDVLSVENIETEQKHQMFNLDNEQTTLQTTLMNIDDELMTVTPAETRDGLKR